MKTGFGLGCPTCKGGVPYYIKNGVEAYCQNCDDMIGLHGKISDIIDYNHKKDGRTNRTNYGSDK